MSGFEVLAQFEGQVVLADCTDDGRTETLETAKQDAMEEIEALKAELRIMANGVIKNCKLCRVLGIGKDEGVCDKCPTLAIERMALKYKGD